MDLKNEVKVNDTYEHSWCLRCGDIEVLINQGKYLLIKVFHRSEYIIRYDIIAAYQTQVEAENAFYKLVK